MQPKMKEGKGEKVSDLLRRILPEILKALMRYARVGTQAALARLVRINTNQISHYMTGQQFPMHNYATLGKHLGLSAGNMWWILGDTIKREFRRFEVKIPGKAGEIRERPAAYDGHRQIADHLLAVLALDLNLLEPDDGVVQHKARQALQASCEEEWATTERKAEILRKQLSAFEDGYHAAAHRARRRIR